MRYAIGQTVRIVHNTAYHHFNIGEIVKIVRSHDNFEVFTAHKRGCYEAERDTHGNRWWVYGTDVEPLVLNYKIEDFL